MVATIGKEGASHEVGAGDDVRDQVQRLLGCLFPELWLPSCPCSEAESSQACRQGELGAIVHRPCQLLVTAWWPRWLLGLSVCSASERGRLGSSLVCRPVCVGLASRQHAPVVILTATRERTAEGARLEPPDNSAHQEQQ